MTLLEFKIPLVRRRFYLTKWRHAMSTWPKIYWTTCEFSWHIGRYAIHIDRGEALFGTE